MDLRLTDVLVCPRCGPPYGLILLADDVREGRVLEGWLGCANCRERYAVRDGLADLRPPATVDAGVAPAATEVAASQAEEAAARAHRLAALMGVAPAGAGRNFALIAGAGARALAAGVAALVEDLEVIAASHAPEPGAELAGVSRMAVRRALPFRDRSMRGVALLGAAAGELLEEALRVLEPPARLVLEGAPPDAAARIAAAGGRVLAEEGGTVVAVSADGEGRRGGG